jgi:hypothetical protein
VAGATVIVGAATGVLTNLITSRWSIAVAVGLGVLLVIGVLLQVTLATGDDRAGSTDSGNEQSLPIIRQAGRARGRGTVIQAGGDVNLSSGRGSSSPDEGKDPVA